MPILNYTTSIAVERTAADIHGLLVKGKATAIMNEYAAGILSSIAFRMDTKHGIIHYKLPANTRGVLAAMQRNKKVPRNKCTMEQAARVGWRIVKDWVEAQLAIIEAEIADMPQVFLPYAVTGTGQTVYERFDKGGCGTLAITYQETAN